MIPTPTPSAHLDPHEVVGYIEATLPPSERGRVEAHLSVCEDCTNELAAVSRLRRPAGRPALRLGLTAAAAAAVAAVVLLAPRAVRRPAAGEAPVRGNGSSAAVAIVTPADGASLKDAPVFTWRPLPGATAYRISVSRADGDPVWDTTVADTTAQAPVGALRPGADVYYWYVDVLLRDGRSIAGPAHQFRLGP